MYRMVLLIVTLILTGCGASYQVGYGPGRVQVQEAFHKIEDKTVRLTLVDGTEFEGTPARLAHDTLQIQWEDIDVPLLVQVPQIRSAVTVNRYAAVNMFLGGLVGGCVGGLIGSSSKASSGHGSMELLSPHDAAVLAGVAVGITVGVVIGSAVSAETKVIFSELNTAPLSAAGKPVTLVVPTVSEKDGCVQFTSGDKIMTLPRETVQLERTASGVSVVTTSRVILSHPPDMVIPDLSDSTENQRPPSEYREKDRHVAIVVPAISEEEGFVSFPCDGKTIRLPGQQVKVERTASGVKISTTPEIFREAGLDLE